MVTRCDKLVNVGPSNVQFTNLEVVLVSECLKMEVILNNSEEEKRASSTNNMILLPKLRSLELENLENLIGFCTSRSEDHPLFNSQVALPALKNVEIVGVPNITEIWDKKLLPAESFRQLQYLEVKRCEKLVNVVPSNVLPRLPNLEVLLVCECLKMEVILDNSEEEKKVTSTDNMILLPKLRSLTLENLKNLVGFCTTSSEDHPLFNSQVALPALEKVRIVDVPNITEIWDKKLLPAESFRQLQSLYVTRCEKLVNVGPSNVLPRLANLKVLGVLECLKMEVIFDNSEEEKKVTSTDNMILLPKLRRLTLKNLKNLVGFCTTRSEDHPLFNSQELVGLQNLQLLVITDCSLLRNLFTSSVATALEQLKGLYLGSCPAMQEVIATDEGHKEIIDEIVFPKLELLVLKDLSNLKSFCSADCNFNFPSLRGVFLKGCPKMQTFSSGSLRMPQMKLCTRGSELLEIDCDLNKYLEQRLVKGEEESSMEEAGYDYGDEDWFLDEVRNRVEQ